MLLRRRRAVDSARDGQPAGSARAVLPHRHARDLPRDDEGAAVEQRLSRRCSALTAARGRRSRDRVAGCLGYRRRCADLLPGTDRQRRLSAHRDGTPLGAGAGAAGGLSTRPGVAATVYLAYTIDDKYKEEAMIPAGSRVTEHPGTWRDRPVVRDQRDLNARAQWNNLRPRVEPAANPGEHSSRQWQERARLLERHLHRT